ncbi:MAG: hypothetical protein EXR50_01835 [Dehalococcoidia bacterium]|nr:hypothetical protein [Dehalococcoidia bacterium]
MAVKAFYSLEPGEAIVADEIKSRYPFLQIFFPEKDKGIDLIVMGDLSRDARYPLSIQVKESRYYGDNQKVHSWHQIHKTKIEDLKDEVDFLVFVTYVDLPQGNKIGFKRELIIVSIEELTKLCLQKKSPKDIYSFYFSFLYDSSWTKVLDVRDMRESYWKWEQAPSYLAYYNNWEQLIDTLEEREDVRAALLALADPETISWEEYKELRADEG